MAKSHPGFAKAQSKIAKSAGVSKKRAGAILAASTRKASAKAKKANPRLRRVKGKFHNGGVVPENGAYELQIGEVVTPALDNGGYWTDEDGDLVYVSAYGDEDFGGEG